MAVLSELRAGLRAVVPSRVTAATLSPTRVLDSTFFGPTDQVGIASPWADDTHLGSVQFLADVFGADALDNLPLTRAAAMSVPAVSRSRTILATTLARLDLVVKSPAADARGAAFIRQPDPAQSRFIMLLWTVDDLVFHGVSWWLILSRYADDNRPRQARRILPGGVELHDGGRITVYGKDTPAADLIRIDGPHEGILNFASRTLRTAARLEASAAKFADNPIPAFELHQTDDFPLTPAQKAAMVAEWVKARKGENGGVAFTSRNIEGKVHGVPNEMLLTTGRNAQAIDCARHVGVPADAIDASPERASMTYATAETRLRVLVDFGLAAYGSAITARLSMDDVVAHGTTVEFDYDGITATTDADPDTAAPPAGTGQPQDGAAGSTEGNPA